MNFLMDITTTKDVLQIKDQVFASNTPIKNKIARYEKTGSLQDAPSLRPLWINWGNLKGRWNETVFDKFVEYAREEEYWGDEDIPEDEVKKMETAFYRRLERMLTELNRNRPKEGEAVEETTQRIEESRALQAGMARRTTRRVQVCITIISENVASDLLNKHRSLNFRGPRLFQTTFPILIFLSASFLRVRKRG